MKRLNFLLYIILIITACSCVDSKTSAKEDRKDKLTATIQDSSGESKATNMPMVLDFYADWCGPCRQFKPNFEKAKKKYSDRIFFRSINVDNEERLANLFHIQYLPTIVLIDSDGNEVARQTGYMDYAQLEKMLNEFLPE